MVSVRYMSPGVTYEDGPYHRLKVYQGHRVVLEVKVAGGLLGDDREDTEAGGDDAPR